MDDAPLNPPPDGPHLRDIAARYQGTSAEWLLTRLIGWHDRVTPERQRDIDNILYLLERCKYLPEDPEHAPFIVLIALVWARLPLALELNGQDEILTAQQVGEQIKAVAGELQWVGKSEFNELLKRIDRAFETEVYPKLEQFDASIERLIKRLNDKSATAVELDSAKIAENIAAQVSAAGKQQFEGIYLAVLGLVAVLAFVIGMVMPVAGHLWGR
jgi:hypothetical protein